MCSPGEYQKSGTQSSCDICPAGSYQPLNGSNTCISCPSGKAGTLTNATSEAIACPEICRPGTYSATSTSSTFDFNYESSHPTVCAICGLNTYAYRPMTGPTCTICPEHSSSEQGSINATNCTCNRGYTGPNGGLCAACDAGKYKPDPGDASCQDCSAGYYGPVAARYLSCLSCGAGTYSHVAASACTGCPANSDSPANSINLTNCTCNR